ncbi:MAG: VCBS repeat-containing protein, partial [Calditrichaeota bacterium]
MKFRYSLIFGILVSFLVMMPLLAQPPANGENEYRLAGVNPRSTGGDTLTANAGRGVWVAHDPDLDNDGLPEILVTDYSDGGRVFVYEVIGNDLLEFVWASKRLDTDPGGGSTPRSVTTGDFDNNGKQEIIFPIGYFATDSVDLANRGIYFYEWTGNDNDYGTDPVYK